MSRPSELENTADDKWAQETVEKFAFDFDKADKDKNGTLSTQEVTEVLRSVGFNGSDEEAKLLFAHLDKDKDDKITRQEFKAALLKLPKMDVKEFVLRFAFLRVDRDRSGYITRAEIMEATKPDSGINIAKKTIEDILKYLDVESDDKKVSYDEFLQVLNFEESASLLNKIFCILDEDKSGFLTRDEIQSAIETEGQLAKLRPRLQKLLKDLAKDQDKKINYHEFVESWLSKKKDVKKPKV